MTADSEKGPSSVVCLICNASVGVSTRNSCPIFKQNVSSSEQPIANILSVILGQEVRKDVVHSEIICKKCYKLCNEVDELQERITEIKLELNNFYQKTLRKIEGHTEEETVPEPAATNTQVIVLTRSKPVKKARGGGDSQPSTTNGDPVPEPGEVLVPMDVEEEEEEEEDQGAVPDDGDEEYIPEGEVRAAGFASVQIKVEAEDDDDDNSSSTSQSMKKRPNGTSKKKESDVPDIIPQMIVSRDGKVYTCLLCSADNKVQGDGKMMSAHMKNDHNIRLYICDICGVEFLKRSDMSAHFDQHVASEEGDFQCDVCNRIFSNLRLFRVHKRMHMPQAKNHVCDTCGKAYLSKNMLDEHMNTHTGNRPYKCKECGKDFASKYTFRAHEKTHTDRPRPYKCSQCGKAFITEANLIQHERTHTATRNYSCQICGKTFSSPRNLEVHCVIHTGYKPFVCRVCGKAFARKAEIRDHERTHTGEKPYQCEFCGATFGQRSNLQSHKRATHYDDKRYQCVECGKAFKRRRLLDYHIKAAHTGERPFKCQICSATFIYPEHFKKHRRIHTGEKPYQCEVCGKAFNSRDNRNAHRFVHSDKKPYECLVCGMGFMRKPQLYNHMQSQGHINDTIVVNQPRLTTDDELIVPADEVEMAIITDADGNQKYVSADQVLDQTGEFVTELQDADGTETKMYISELKEHVILQRKVTEEDGQEAYDEDLVVEGQVHFADGETLETLSTAGNMSLEGQHSLVVPATRHGAEFTVDASNSTTVQTADGPVHLVHISLPDSAETAQGAWFNIVHE